MKSNAPGQLLGYTIQFPRALLHLLRSGPGGSVCVEVLGDVATIKPDGTVIDEEDKSSVANNPLTDRSTDLWKTFSNWIAAIRNGDLNVSKTQFVLFCNRSGQYGLVDEVKDRRQESAALFQAKIQLDSATIFTSLVFNVAYDRSLVKSYG